MTEVTDAGTAWCHLHINISLRKCIILKIYLLTSQGA